MGMRRFTRLTNGFSKKVENLAHAVSLHYMHYNFARIHQSLTIENEDGTRTKQTPAMAAGVADHVWNAARDRRAARVKLTHYRKRRLKSRCRDADKDLGRNLLSPLTRISFKPLPSS